MAGLTQTQGDFGVEEHWETDSSKWHTRVTRRPAQQYQDYIWVKGQHQTAYMDQDYGNYFFNLNCTTELKDLGTIKVNTTVASELFNSQIFTWHRAAARKGEFRVPCQPKHVECQLQNEVWYPKQTFRRNVPIQGLPRGCSFLHCGRGLNQEAPLFERTWLLQWLLRLETPTEVQYGKLQDSAQIAGLSRAVSKLWNLKLLQMLSLLKKWRSQNFYPSFPSGDTLESLEKERLELLTEISIRNNERVIADKMARTFAYRRQEVGNQEPRIKDFKDRWPDLFQQREVFMEVIKVCIFKVLLQWGFMNWSKLVVCLILRITLLTVKK